MPIMVVIMVEFVIVEKQRKRGYQMRERRRTMLHSRQGKDTVLLTTLMGK